VSTFGQSESVHDVAVRAPERAQSRIVKCSRIDGHILNRVAMLENDRAALII
jgi:hypothetical protein